MQERANCSHRRLPLHYITCSAMWLQRALSAPEGWRWTQHLHDIIQYNSSAARCTAPVVLRTLSSDTSFHSCSNISDASLGLVELTGYVLSYWEWPSMIPGRTWVNLNSQNKWCSEVAPRCCLHTLMEECDISKKSLITNFKLNICYLNDAKQIVYA